MISISDPLAISITFTFLALATVALLIRCDLRYRVKKNHGPEDILVICAWVRVKTLSIIMHANSVQLLAIPEQILLFLSIRRYKGVDPQQVTYLKVGAKKPHLDTFINDITIDVLLDSDHP